jgi:hypothetical protein
MCIDDEIWRIASLAGRTRVPIVPDLDSIAVEVNVRLNKIDGLNPAILTLKPWKVKGKQCDQRCHRIAQGGLQETRFVLCVGVVIGKKRRGRWERTPSI